MRKSCERRRSALLIPGPSGFGVGGAAYGKAENAATPGCRVSRFPTGPTATTGKRSRAGGATASSRWEAGAQRARAHRMTRNLMNTRALAGARGTGALRSAIPAGMARAGAAPSTGGRALAALPLPTGYPPSRLRRPHSAGASTHAENSSPDSPTPNPEAPSF
jgi:hypothetical protein